MPATDLISPCGIGPASVTPRCNGWSVVCESSRYESIISGTFDAFTAILHVVEVDLVEEVELRASPTRPAPRV